MALLAVVSRYQSVLAYVASRGGCDSPDSDSSDNEFPEASGSKEDGASETCRTPKSVISVFSDV